MNNDKPASESQQTDINRLQFEAKLSEFISSQQSIPPDIAKVVRECFWDLIEDTRKAQPSHSPTEQPGDAKHTPGPWLIRGEHTTYSIESRAKQICEVTGQIHGIEGHRIDEETKANAELIARAPALLSEVATLRSKQAELVAENARLLEQLRSERDKMKSDRDAWKGGVVNE